MYHSDKNQGRKVKTALDIPAVLPSINFCSCKSLRILAAEATSSVSPAYIKRSIITYLCVSRNVPLVTLLCRLAETSMAEYGRFCLPIQTVLSWKSLHVVCVCVCVYLRGRCTHAGRVAPCLLLHWPRPFLQSSYVAPSRTFQVYGMRV